MWVFKKKTIIIFSVLLATFFTIILCVSAISARPVGEASASKIKVVLDAGHGGVDGGVLGKITGVKESDLNLKVVKKLETYLINAGMSVALTRNSEAGLYGVSTNNLKKRDMQKRSEIINSVSPDLVVSVHMNKYSLSTRRGAQVFYKYGDEVSKILAQNIQKSFNEMDGAIREYSALTGDYYMLKCTDYPSVLVECGFLSNAQDETLLTSSEYRKKLAYAIFKGAVSVIGKKA